MAESAALWSWCGPSLSRMHARGRARLTNQPRATTIEELPPNRGPVAQLGARFHGMEEVIGSIPIRSTKYFKHLEAPPFSELWAT